MAQSVQNTVVGVFRDETTAKAVVEELVTAGISRDRVHLRSRSDWTTAAAAGGSALTGQSPAPQHGGFMNWLESIFGSDTPEDYRQNYAETVRRGNYVVTVDGNDSEHNRIVSVMEKNNAVDIDEEVTNYRARGYTGFDPNTRPYTDAEIVREREHFNRPIAGQEAGLQGQTRFIPAGKEPMQRSRVRVFSRTV